MQGLNLTANHSHAALFGVYGMLGLGLTRVWARVPGDIVFSVGVFGFVWFVYRAFIPKRQANG